VRRPREMVPTNLRIGTAVFDMFATTTWMTVMKMASQANEGDRTRRAMRGMRTSAERVLKLILYKVDTGIAVSH